MKRINMFLALLLTGSTLSFGAKVPLNTAKNVGYSYLQRHGNSSLQSVEDLQLLYTSAKGNAYYYVFGTNNCFVVVSAEDGVIPVLGYSNENTFKADHMPDNISSFLDGYNEQIDYVIKNNIAPSTEIASDWAALTQGKYTAAKTTAAVTPLLTTHWDQGSYYNALCPADAASGASLSNHVPTGCVATAMAQVMRYWNWPTTGVSSHTYTSDYGALSANFATTTYNWTLMPFSVTATNTPVATLMAHLGIAVNMGYAAAESGSYVTQGASPITNCAEYALKTYFKYPTVTGIARSSMSSATWTATIKTELDASRPVIYDGQGSSGGHCFVFDGYDATGNFHVNWGWSGNSDGYFTVDALNPAALGTGGGGGGFNSQQHIITHIQPSATPPVLNPDIYEVNDLATTAYTLPLTWTSNVATKATTGSNFHVTSDKDYYKIVLEPGYNYSIKARLDDAIASDDATTTYTADALWAYSLNGGASFIASYNDTMPSTSTINIVGYTGGTVTFRVIPKYQGTTGTYLFKLLNIKRSTATGIEEVMQPDAVIFPNPATTQVTVDLSNTGKKAINAMLTDMQGRKVYTADVTGQTRIVIPVETLASGTYLLNVATDNGTIEKKIVVGTK